GRAGRFSCIALQIGGVDAQSCEISLGVVAEKIAAYPANEADVGTKTRRHDGLVRPFAAVAQVEGMAAQRLPRLRQPRRAKRQVDIRRAENADGWWDLGHAFSPFSRHPRGGTERARRPKGGG